MGWIVAILMAFVASIALAMIWRANQRRVKELRSSHQKAVRHLDEEHHRRIKRLNREHDRTLQAAHFPLTKDLLPALDSLDEALTHVADQDLDTNGDLAEFQTGIDLARSALHDALARHGITPIAPEPGESFNPTIHEAIARNDDPDQEPGTIRRLLRPGYGAEDRVLRSALVEVNVGPSPPEDDIDEDELDPQGASEEVDEDLDDGADPDAFEDPGSGNSISSVGAVASSAIF